MLLRAPPSLFGVAMLLGCASAPISNTTHCEPLPEGPWLQQSPGGTPEVVASVLDAHRCDFRVIDVREARELTGSLGIIEGAEHIPQREIGGDAGELIVALSAAEQLSERRFTREDLRRRGAHQGIRR